MHKKLTEMPREWPLPRKGKKYIALASDQSSDSIPLLFVLRDILGIAKTRREVRKICLSEQVKINDKVRKDDVFPIRKRDVIEIVGKNKLILVQEGKRFVLKETKENKKISKIIGKKVISKNVVQANLDDGSNKIIKETFSCGDSIIIEFGKKGSTKIIPLTKGSKVEVIGGRHIGQIGKVEGAKEEGKKKVFEVKLGGGKDVLLSGKILLAIE